MRFDECDRMKIWKIFSLLFVLGVVSIVACAMISDDSSAEVTSGTTGDCTWTLDGTKLTISGNGAIADRYSESLPWKESITEVVIENGVTYVGNYAFYNCTSLTSITIPDSVTSIGGGVFSGCESLTSITIPNSVTFIDDGAFWDCTSLISITIPSSVTSIGDRAFRVCSSLTSITIPNGVTSIGECAFHGCSSLTSITIPDSVTSIGRYAFWECTSLTSITIPNSVTSIGEGAFSRCTSLTSITIPNSVTSMGWAAFSYCRSLTSITIPNSVTSIGDYAFSYCRSLTSITIPNSVTSIDYFAFSGCSSLTSITIPNGVTSIGDLAFYPLKFYESNGIDKIEPTAENLAGYTFINKSGKMVKQEGVPPSTTTYTVTFRVNGNVIDTVSYDNGATSITEPKIPNIKGYDARWPQYTLSGDITVDAVLTPKEYKVIYKVDENIVFTDVYKYDSKVTVRDTYSDGKNTYTPWTTNDVIVTNNTFTMIDSDVTFKSTSSAARYTATFRVNGNVIDTIPYNDGDTSITEPKIPNIKGYDARWPQYILSGDIIIDAILTPKEYKVIYKIDEEIIFTDVYKYDSKVIIRDTYSDGKYTYTPWTTNDVIVSDESFTMIDSDVTFNSTSSAVKYMFIVKYVDTDGKEIHPQYQGEARCDAIISPDIPSISGYRSPDERISIKITEDLSKNVVIYTYSLEDVETEGSSGFSMTSVVVGAIIAVIAIAAIAFVIKKH